MNQKIRKAIIPAAGFGTRFLPATKAMPKEMLPIVDKPVIQYVVEEAVAAGIEDIVIVTGWHKRSIEDHFDYPFELEKRLLEAGKEQQAEQVRKIAEMANFIYVRQKGPYGNATPILNAKRVIGDEPFLVLWGDDFFYGQPSRARQLIDAYEKHADAVAILASIRANKDEDYKRYGYAAGKEKEKGFLKIEQLIEKPGPGMIDSDYAVVSGALYSPLMFGAIEEAMRRLDIGDTKRELVYIDALNILLEQKQSAYALEIKNGKFYDTGNKLEYLKAVVEFGLRHEELKDEFGEYLKNLKS